MKDPLSSQFLARSTGGRVEGEIRRSQDQDFLAWANWRYNRSDEDKNWDWWAIYLECKQLPQRYECYSAFATTELQGLMVLDLRARRSKVGAAITVDYLATNPMNRQPHSGLKHVGLALIGAGLLRSIEAGKQGRLWLEALPGAAGFYQNLGFERLPGLSDDGNAIYTLDSATAKSLLDEIKTHGIVSL
jgi:hypothetical protein